MITLVALSVLMLLVGGAIQFTNRNREAATEKIRGDRISLCADAARRHLFSRLTLHGSPTESFEAFDVQLLDNPDNTARTSMQMAHYGAYVDPEDPLNSKANLTVKEVSMETLGESKSQVASVGNVFGPGSGSVGGRYYRAVVRCQEPSANPSIRGREFEIEFLFRYGF